MRQLISSSLGLICIAIVGCGDDEAIQPESTAPIVGLLELPISHRSGAAEPRDPARIELAPAAFRLDGATLFALENGRVPATERQGNEIAKLRAALSSGAARRAAAVRAHVNVPYETLVLVVATIKAAGLSQIAFQVRKVADTPAEGWLDVAAFEVRDYTNDLVEHGASAQRTWNEFTAGWDQAYEACRADHYVDCAGKPGTVAEGGNVEIRIFTRGTAVKVELNRFGGPEPEQPARPAPEMLDGLPPQGGAVEEEPPPATHAAFTWRFAATTDPQSPISLAMRPLCGARVCGVVVTADADTPVMRPLSLLGAMFPDGAQPPQLIFLRPQS